MGWKGRIWQRGVVRIGIVGGVVMAAGGGAAGLGGGADVMELAWIVLVAPAVGGAVARALGGWPLGRHCAVVEVDSVWRWGCAGTKEVRCGVVWRAGV